MSSSTSTDSHLLLSILSSATMSRLCVEGGGLAILSTLSRVHTDNGREIEEEQMRHLLSMSILFAHAVHSLFPRTSATARRIDRHCSGDQKSVHVGLLFLQVVKFGCRHTQTVRWYCFCKFAFLTSKMILQSIEF